MLMLVNRFTSLLSALAHDDIRKRGDASNYIAHVRGAEMNTPDDKKGRIIGFK